MLGIELKLNKVHHIVFKPSINVSCYISKGDYFVYYIQILKYNTSQITVTINGGNTKTFLNKENAELDDYATVKLCGKK